MQFLLSKFSTRRSHNYVWLAISTLSRIKYTMTSYSIRFCHLCMAIQSSIPLDFQKSKKNRSSTFTNERISIWKLPLHKSTFPKNDFRYCKVENRSLHDHIRTWLTKWLSTRLRMIFLYCTFSRCVKYRTYWLQRSENMNEDTLISNYSLSTRTNMTMFTYL